MISEDTPDDGAYRGDEPALYASGFRLAGTVRGIATRVPGAPAAGRDLAAVAGTGEAWSVPMRFTGRIESSARGTLLRDAFVEAGRPALTVRLGDSYPAVDAFRNQAETRRGVAASAVHGPLDARVLASPAGFAAAGPGGAATGSLYGANARLSGAKGAVHAGGFHGAGGPGTAAAPVSARRSLAHLGAEARAGAGAGISVAGALSRSADSAGVQRSGGALRAEARNRWPLLQGGVIWERADRGFRSLGPAGGYAGGEWVEVAQRLGWSRLVQPYTRWRRAGGAPAEPGFPSTQPVGTLLALGLAVTLGRDRSLDVSRRDESLPGAALRRGYLAQAAGSLGGAFSAQALFEQESSRGTALDLTTRHALAGLTWTTETHGLWRVFGDVATTRTDDPTGRRVGFAWGVEGYHLSLTERWRIRGTGTMRTSASPGPARPTGSLDVTLACGGRWRGLDVEPEARVSRVDWRGGGGTPEYSGTLRVSQSFALRAFPVKAEVTGRVWDDADGDGLIDPDERTVAGAAILLDGDRRALSDADGRFVFRDLPEGVYRLSADPWDLPVGLRPAADRPVILTLSRGTTEVDVAVRGEGTR